MSARIKWIEAIAGIDIYHSANTHPGSRTKSYIVFESDRKLRRFRYKVDIPSDKLNALSEARHFAKTLSHEPNNTGA